jgi:predicted HicB family RNase H-like nuclease
MSSTLQHRGYEGSVQYSAEDKMLHGRLLTARDLISYGGIDLAELEINFRDAVDEYLAFCSETGKAPDAPIRTSDEIEVSISPDLKAQALHFAKQHDRGFDSVVNDALEQYLAKAS